MSESLDDSVLSVLLSEVFVLAVVGDGVAVGISLVTWLAIVWIDSGKFETRFVWSSLIVSCQSANVLEASASEIGVKVLFVRLISNK